MNKFERFIVSFISIFLIVFAVSLFAKVVIDAIIFSQKVVSIFYLLIDILVAFVISIPLTLFYQINNISSGVQAVVTYTVVLLVVYIFGGFSGWFTIHNIKFVLISISFNVIGLACVIIFLFLHHKRENEELNQQLASYKERGQNEED